jgi:hypothetical protein
VGWPALFYFSVANILAENADEDGASLFLSSILDSHAFLDASHGLFGSLSMTRDNLSYTMATFLDTLVF